jgi:5-carboxymethyl-2-hydroxymuconate isomerase
MRFLSFQHAGASSWGAVVGEGAGGGVVDLGARLGGSLQQSLEHGDLAAAAEYAAGRTADHALSDIVFLPPVPRPDKIACIGVNYANRNEEYRDGSQAPAWPSLFMRTVDSLTGHEQPLWRPPESHQLDYEGEIVIVIGRGGHRIARERALEHIAGLTLMNEGTLRDWVRHAKFNVTQGKNFVRSGSVGPWLVSADEFDAYDDLGLTTRVNGERRQQDTTANLSFPFDFLIGYLSTFFILKPGDLIATGTPAGAGARFDPPKYLVPGDTVEVEGSGLGTLRNGVIDDPTVA